MTVGCDCEDYAGRDEHFCGQPSAPAQLDRAAVAARFSIKPASVTVEVRRGSLPKPDGYVGRSPYWWSTTLDEWQRPGRTGRPKKEIGEA